MKRREIFTDGLHRVYVPEYLTTERLATCHQHYNPVRLLSGASGVLPTSQVFTCSCTGPQFYCRQGTGKVVWSLQVLLWVLSHTQWIDANNPFRMKFYWIHSLNWRGAWGMVIHHRVLQSSAPAEEQYTKSLIKWVQRTRSVTNLQAKRNCELAVYKNWE